MMDSIHIPATDRSPLVDFDVPAGCLSMRGESYPEDAAAFFGPLQQAVRDYLGRAADRPLAVEVALSYFNSSSAKALMNLFMLLEDEAEAGRPVSIRWLYAEGDETIEEAGEDFGADFVYAKFDLVQGAPG